MTSLPGGTVRRCLMLLAAAAALSAAARAELQPEAIGRVATLPERYPAHWIIAHDVAFYHIRDGKSIVLDADADTIGEQFKGMFNSTLAADFTQAVTRPEMYVAETYYSRGVTGDKTDVLTIYDKRSLARVGEVIFSGHRAVTLPQKFQLQLTGNEKFALIYNFSPAMSVSVIDLIARVDRGEVPIPGCAAVFPTGDQAFSSICGDGSLYTATLTDDGRALTTRRSERFFDPEADPLIEKPAWVGGRAWFPTFAGNVQPVDFSGARPVVGEPWPLLGPDTAGWRPGGPSPSSADANGRIYFLAHPDGREGTHRDPGIEAWVFDPETRQRLARYPLQLPAVSIALTRDTEAPLMIVTNVEMNLDVYDAATGSLLRTLANFGQETPLLVFGAR